MTTKVAMNIAFAAGELMQSLPASPMLVVFPWIVLFQSALRSALQSRSLPSNVRIASTEAQVLENSEQVSESCSQEVDIEEGTNPAPAKAMRANHKNQAYIMTRRRARNRAPRSPKREAIAITEMVAPSAMNAGFALDCILGTFESP